MARFVSEHDYTLFAHYLRYTSRHFLDTNQRRFVNAVIRTSKGRSAKISSDTVLWRAALGCLQDLAGEHPVYGGYIDPYPIERMKPLRGRAFEGRLNPKGIPCLYCATDAATAMIETRPWGNSYLTVAELVLLKDVSVIDCSASVPNSSGASSEKFEVFNWEQINAGFSEPTGRIDDMADYAPTQFLAEAFASAGFEGVIYKSKSGQGNNVALFDIDAAEVASRCVYSVATITAKFQSCDRAVYVEKYKHRLCTDPRDLPGEITDDDVPF
jgi:hypothetical protein